MEYTPTIGLEIHVELKTKSKMFCGCPNGFGLEVEPNINVCPICLGHPGTLPVINQETVKAVLKLGAALGGKIPDISKFDRKNYFYPDLPKGYQISQYDQPLVIGGELNSVKLTRIHLEEDTGRLMHAADNDYDYGKSDKNRADRSHRHQSSYSLVDFNRAGVPLMELVTEPVIQNGKEAVAFAKELQLTLRYLGIADADMERGQMRIEANVSVGIANQLGTKVEIKNLNSFRAVEGAVDYEIRRQTAILEKREKVAQETRGWNDVKEITVSQRTKEEAHDYRYFPEPDLPPLNLTRVKDEVLGELIELPAQKRIRFKNEYNLPENDIEILVQNKPLGDYFENVVSESKRWEFDEHLRDKKGELIKLTANYLITELQKLLKQTDIGMANLKITPENFAEFIVLIKKGEISSSGAQTLLAEMVKTGADPSHIIELKDLRQVSDTSELEKIAKEVIDNNPEPVNDYQKGKQQALQFLVGKIMAESKNKAHPQIAKEILEKLLK